ncbi:ATP-binding protein [Leeia sp.]|uniref:ATP-binding protein n=1 Tax=Leeia sp. TaxID=2884678 RepID=UPI0035B47C78
MINKKACFTLFGIVLSGVALSGLAWWYYHGSVQTLERDITAREQEVLAVHANEMDLELDRYARQVKLLTYTLGGERNDPESLQQRMLQALQGLDNTQIFGVGIWFEPGVFASDGKPFNRFVGHDDIEAYKYGIQVDWLHNQEDFRTKEWYQSTLKNKGQVLISEPYFDVSEPYVTVARSFSNEQGKPEGAVTIDVLLSSIRQELLSKFSRNQQWVMLFSSRGLLLYHPNHAGILQVANSQGWGVSDMMEIKPGQVRKIAAMEHGALLRPAGYRYLRATVVKSGWVMEAAIPESYWSVPVARLWNDHIIIQLIIWMVTAIALFLFRIMSRHQVRLEKAKEEAEAQRSASQLEIWQMAERFEILFLSNMDAVFLLNDQGISEVNRAAVGMFRARSSEDVLNHDFKAFFPHRQENGQFSWPAFLRKVREAESRGSCRFEFEFSRFDQETFHAEVVINNTHLDDGFMLQMMLRDITERKVNEQQLWQEREAQKQLIYQLEQAQNQLLQSEKMAAIGQLAAGVAHEINNPTGFVASNLNSLGKYLNDLTGLNQIYLNAEGELSEATRGEVARYKKQIDYDFLLEDTTALLTESRDGIDRVKRIVQDLKDFSHVDEGEWLLVDLHKGLDSTLNVVRNEIKYKADVIKEYGEIPSVETIPSQLNQVFLNILVNAAQAIESFGTITLRSGAAEDRVWISIQDSGKGISPENLKRIFEPFFTTKPVGQGTGLGLSLVFGIMKKLGGYITVSSEVGVGTCFTIHLPVRRGEVLVAAEA